MLIGFDTETFLIQPGVQAPRLVCLQTEERIYHSQFDRQDLTSDLTKWLSDPNTTLVAHNAAFDTTVLCAEFPDLIPLIFEAYRADRILCTQMADTLIEIAHGSFGPASRFDLASCLRRRDSTVFVDKSDPWRLRYSELIDTPVSEWPSDAIRYAAQDAYAVTRLFMAQSQWTRLSDLPRQSRAAFWIRLMECRGIATDPVRVREVHDELIAERDSVLADLCGAGLVRADGSRDTWAAMQLMAACCEEPPLTDAGIKLAEETGLGARDLFAQGHRVIKLDEESCDASGHPLLIQYGQFSRIGALLSRIPRLYHSPIQSRFSVLQATGRTACSNGDPPKGQAPSAYGFQLQNLPRKGRLRECFVPRDGFVFSSVDYDGIELRTWAQVCLWLVGRSHLAEVLNAGRDPHTELGARLAGIAPETAYALDGEERKKFRSESRQFAKIPNFGLPGGMGPATLQRQARSEYGLDVPIETVTGWCAAWRSQWPEAEDYFTQIRRIVDSSGGLATIAHFGSGRVRGLVRYTQACNTFFQGLAADVAKAAGFAIAEECYADPSSPLYGSRIVNFIHDEFILETPEEIAHEAAQRQAQIMIDVAQAWIPDVQITASPALMRRWHKSAEARYADGRLVPWD